MVWIAWAIIALANIGCFFCEKTWWWPTTGSTQISGTPHLCQRQVIIRNQLVDDCMLGFGWEIWLSVHPILELGEIRVSWHFIISHHPKRSWMWLSQHRFWGGKQTLIPFLEKNKFLNKIWQAYSKLKGETLSATYVIFRRYVSWMSNRSKRISLTYYSV